MAGDAGLVFGFVLDGRGGARELSWQEIRRWKPEDGVLWLHLDHAVPEARAWLEGESGIDPVYVEALLVETPRPRSIAIDDALLVFLRAINLNEGAEPEDMVSIRMWLERERIVTLRHRKVNAAKWLAEALRAGNGPRGAGDLLVAIIDRILDRIGVVVSAVDEFADDLENKVLTQESFELRTRIAELRRKAIELRRYISPQRDGISRLGSERVDWLSELDRVRLRELADRLTRIVEDLDSARERAAVTQEELGNRLSEQMNRNMYVLSLVASIFLPLGLITGVLGVNLGGIPGTTNPWGFWILCAGLLALSVVQIILFRKMRWL